MNYIDDFPNEYEETVLMGSCLSGQVQSEQYHYLKGKGSNGKSVLFDFVKERYERWSGNPFHFLIGTDSNVESLIESLLELFMEVFEAVINLRQNQKKIQNIGNI